MTDADDECAHPNSAGSNGDNCDELPEKAAEVPKHAFEMHDVRAPSEVHALEGCDGAANGHRAANSHVEQPTTRTSNGTPRLSLADTPDL